jgi:3-hydroxyisobutyrate dehydrogenase-like beta-hydroxyacid dehydrogenase
MDAKKLTEGQRSYEAKRAAKAGMSLEAWLRDKEKRAKEEAAAAAKVAEAETPAKKPGFFTRLMDRAHKPI